MNYEEGQILLKEKISARVLQLGRMMRRKELKCVKFFEQRIESCRGTKQSCLRSPKRLPKIWMLHIRYLFFRAANIPVNCLKGQEVRRKAHIHRTTVQTDLVRNPARP